MKNQNYQAHLWLAAVYAGQGDAEQEQMLLAEAQKQDEKAAVDYQQVLNIIKKHSS